MRCNQVGARGVHTPMAGWPAGALVPSSPKVRLGLDHQPAYAHGSPRPTNVHSTGCCQHRIPSNRKRESWDSVLSAPNPETWDAELAQIIIYILRAGAYPDSMEHSGEDLSGLSPLEGQGGLYHHYHRRASAGGGVVHVAAPVKSDASLQQAAQQTAHASCNASSFSSRRPTVPVVPVVPAGSFMHHGCAALPPAPGVHVPAACGGGVGASTHSTPGGAPQWFVNADGASIPVVQPLNLPHVLPPPHGNMFPT